MSATYQSTTDANAVTRVWASFSYDSVFPEIDPDAPEADDIIQFMQDFNDRLSAAYVAFENDLRFHFPNATDVQIESTGWNGDWARFSPRAETEDGTPYEFFFDWLVSIQDSLGK